MVRPHSSNTVLTLEHLREVIRVVKENGAFAFDIETIGDDRGEPVVNEVAWIGIATDGLAVSIPMAHPNGNVLISKETRRKNKETGKFVMIPARYDDPPAQLYPSEVFAELEELFFDPDLIAIAHNATFDVSSIAKYFDGRLPTCLIHDTIVIQWLLDENLLRMGLKYLVDKYYHIKYDHENVGKCVEKHPFWKVARYLHMDVKYTWLLWKRLEPLLAKDNVRDVFELEMELLPVLCRMRLHGAPVDEEAIRRLEVEVGEDVVDAMSEIFRAAGRKFNLNAPAQKAEVLFSPKKAGGQGIRPKVPTDAGKKKLDKGADPKDLPYKEWSTGAEVIEQYAGNPVVDGIIKYQELNKVLTTYIQGYLGVEGDKDRPCRIFNGHVHTDLVQYGTVTGRFSSREPNLQNIPRPDTDLGKKIRGLFKAPPGYTLVVADYGQIEMVVLAYFVGYGALYDGIKNGMDPHSATAAALMDMDPEEFMKQKKLGNKEISAMRQVAKGINFAVVYGAGPDKVAKMAGITVKEAKKFLELHKEMFPEIYVFKDKVIKVARSRRPVFIRTILGRKRRLPTLFAKDWATKGKAERQAVNSLIQGSAADIIKKAMIRLDSMLEDDMHLILSVHDELVTITPIEKAEKCQQIVNEAMTGEWLEEMLNGVPLNVDNKIVPSWDLAK